MTHATFKNFSALSPTDSNNSSAFSFFLKKKLFKLMNTFVINRCGTDVRVFDEAGVKGGEEDDTKKLYGKFGKVASSFCPNFRFCLCLEKRGAFVVAIAVTVTVEVRGILVLALCSLCGPTNSTCVWKMDREKEKGVKSPLLNWGEPTYTKRHRKSG
ncbi:hypothetical protein M9H77_14929 [Catharanthus roseus]|uniref:Uncharacterized protein n=1 Tax=Catharanthus roseus TaxID=4058 RepID=A0ACC0BPL1_CATRO|nr:hypothetical protein M9H77_14929 [Catharanthus roseus]